MLLYLIQCLKSQGIFGVRYSAKPKANQLSPKVGYLQTTVILGAADSLSTLAMRYSAKRKTNQLSSQVQNHGYLLACRSLLLTMDALVERINYTNPTSTCGPAGYVCQFCHIPVRLERQSLALWSADSLPAPRIDTRTVARSVHRHQHMCRSRVDVGGLVRNGMAVLWCDAQEPERGG
jgi:hypothetical protein